ncbi:MAG: sel1 repeat family protein [Pararhodobacter sp.]|nr:sel1 repeat family protein [Pararhodobacter sp.]
MIRLATVAALVATLALPVAAQDFDTVWQQYRDRDYAAAFEGFRALSEQGDAEATYWLGEMYFWGRGAGDGGPERDQDEAFRIWHPAAEEGHARSQWRLGWFYRHGRGGAERDHGEAARWLEMAVGQGHAQSMNDLGELYLGGHAGLERDEDRAYELFSQAAQTSPRAAAFNLARMYWREGIGPHDDDEQALHWFRISADANYGPAIRELGHAYWEGRGVERDLMEALRLIYLSESRGGGDSTRTMLSILGEMTPEERARADELVEIWDEEG